MRIISGKAGGIRLNAPSGKRVRPTSDRVKESLFSTIGAVDGWRVLDLFAGSGALGLEALSRGARTVTFVERDGKALRCLETNVQNVQKALGKHADVKIICADAAVVPRLLAAEAGTYDLILADPPYQVRSDEFGATALLRAKDFNTWAGEALLVLEHGADTEPPWLHTEWLVIKQRRFGIRMLTYLRSGAKPNSVHS